MLERQWPETPTDVPLTCLSGSCSWGPDAGVELAHRRCCAHSARSESRVLPSVKEKGVWNIRLCRGKWSPWDPSALPPLASWPVSEQPSTSVLSPVSGTVACAFSWGRRDT